MKTNFTFYLKSSLMVLFLCLGLSSWGQTEILTINRSHFPTGTGYTASTWTATASTGEAITGQSNLYLNTVAHMQIGGTQLPHPYNSVEIPGAITKIQITMPGSGTPRQWTPRVSESNVLTSASGGTSLTPQTFASNSGTLTWDLDASDNYKFFYLQAGGNTNIASITIEYEVATSCEASNLTFTDTTVNKDLLDPSFTQTATSLNGTTAITYESSDELVATVNANGEVTLVGIGTATITASQEAGEHSGVDYCAGTATYDVVVTTSIPLLAVSTNSASFSGFAGGAVATETITVEGLNLTGDIALALSGDTNFSINPASLSSTGGEVTITYTPSATPATHSATLTVSNGALSEVITLSGVTNEMPEEYAGVGTFEKITSMSDLEDGYYVFVGDGTNAMNTTISSNKFQSTTVTVSDNKIINPAVTIVWKIETDNGNVKTIYNEIEKDFVSGGGSNTNVNLVTTVSGNSQKWGASVINNLFRFINQNQTSRALWYNGSVFGQYSTSNTSGYYDLELYKLQTSSATQVATPTITVTGVENGVDTYFNTANITLATTTDGATIYYTTDGTEPTTASTVYTTSFDITATATIKAIAVAADLDDSFVAEKTITIIEPATATVPYTEAFDNTLGDWITYNAEGTITTWSASTYGATVNGYNNGAADAWLISPKFTSGAASLDLVFDYDSTYGAGDLLVKYSINYTGYGDPSLATWQDLPVITHTNNGSTIVNGSYSEILTTTGDIHLAFVYQQSSDWVRWNIRDLMIDIAPTSAIVWTTDGEWSNVTGPTINDDVVIEGDLFVGTDVTSFEAKTLTVASTVAVYIESGNSVTVAGAIDNQAGAANFIVESGANLVQIDEAVNVGDITVHVTAETEFYGYNMFSSPVAGQTFADFSEITSDEILTYSYDPINGDEWVATTDTAFELGLGYMFAAPWTAPAGQPTEYNREFTGIPNNGTVELSVSESFIAIGNPYPSAIDADEFMLHNNIVGAIHIWRNEHFYNYGAGEYAGVNYITINDLATVGAEGGNIEAGQGFVVATDAGTIEFTNEMRLAESAGVFYKPASSDKHILWLNLYNENNMLNQIAVGYAEGATEGYDNQMDAKMFGYAGSALYSLIANDNSAYVIQGRSLPFTNTDIVPLGFRATQTGNYTVSLADFTGVFADGQDIFIKDNLTQTEQNLKDGNYTFTSETGVFENRFEVIYQANGGLNVNNPDLNNKWVVYSQDNGFQIEVQGFEMKEVVVYDMLGRTVYNSSAEGTSHTIEQAGANGVLIVKVLTADNQTLTRKVVK